ncbi:MAG: multi-sensor hybrid histidine kinase [Polyangiaceae bacterium]|nr:multi-sensor hybrid histidine kinase [Polyangiaceae bacterium]
MLLVDDDRIQLKLSTLRLQDAGFVVMTASSAREALDLAAMSPPDVVMSDVIMGELDGFGLCRRLKEQPGLADVPVILLSAHYNDQKARELAVRVGASALIGRTPEFDAELRALRVALGQDRSSSKLARAVDVTETYEEQLRINANQMSRLAGAARSAEERYRALFESANDAISVLDRSGAILEANERWRIILGLTPASLIGKHLLDFAPRGRDTTGAELAAAIDRGSGRVHAVAIERPDNAIVYMDFSISVIDLEGSSVVLAIGRDVTGRFLAAQALATAEEKYRSLVERMPDVVWTSAAGRCTFVTSNIERLTGFTPAEIYVVGRDFWLERVHPDDEEEFSAKFVKTESDGSGRRFDLEYRWRRKDGTWAWLWHRSIANYERGGLAYTDGLLSDITQRKELEQSLRQAQKMEALGQLTGGIAHDFNNILATILANSQFLIDALGDKDPRLADANEIKLASERAANLTRQLLAFSRKQVLEFRISDLNEVVAGVERMLRRLIGEDIEMSVLLADDLGRAKVDAGQIEQVLMNLAVNARDAMPRGGKLTVETSNAELDAEYQSRHANGDPGRYVVLSVSDSGTGMDAETQRRIFEPFFTTKEQGKGTGLGLATCHGIVTQSGGHIGVYSELGQGSVFKVYLPRVDPDGVADQLWTKPKAEPGGQETVLLVEDDPPLRAAVQRMLASQGYRVLAARHGQEATQLALKHGDEIALLITDVVMPNLSGPEVAKSVKAHVPNLKVLFMSGYTDHAVLRSGELNAAVNFLQKPFSSHALTRKVREAING